MPRKTRPLLILSGSGGLAPLVAFLQATLIPLGGELPQSLEVHYISFDISSASDPIAEALAIAEDALIAACEHHVVPHVLRWNEEVRDLIAFRRRCLIDIPSMRGIAIRTISGNEDMVIIGEEVGQGEAIPATTTPPQRPLAHHREA